MSSFTRVLPVTNITGVSELLADFAGQEKFVHQSLTLPGSTGKSLSHKTKTLTEKRTSADTNDVMMILENQAVMAKWHTEISFYSRMLHLTLNAADTVIKGQ